MLPSAPVEQATLLAELKRRRVLRPVAGYGIAAFGVLQVIEPVMHGLRWPDAVLTWSVIALAAGFPVTLVFAWVFYRRSEDRGVSARAGPWVARNPAVTALAAAVLLLLGLVAAQALSQLGQARRTLARAYLEQAREAQRESRGADARRLFDAALREDPTPAARFEASIDWSAFSPLERVEVHASWVPGIAFAPDGVHAATGSVDGTVSLRRTGSYQELRRFDTGENQISGCLAFTPDSRTLYSAQEYGNLWAWDVASGRVVAHLTLPATARSLAIAPDGKLLAVGRAVGSFSLYDLSGGAPRPREGGGAGHFASFSPDGSRLAAVVEPAAGKESVIRIFEGPGFGSSRILGSGARGYSRPRFLPDGTLLTASHGVVLLWDVTTGKQLARLDESATSLVTAATAVSSDGRLLAVAGRDRAWLFALPSLRQVASIPLPVIAFDVAFAPGSAEVVVAMRSSFLLRWRFRALVPVEGHLRDGLFVADSHSIAVALDSGVALFDGDSGRQLASAPGGTTWLASAPANGARLAAARDDNAVDILRTGDLAVEARIANGVTGPSPKQRTTVGLSPDGGVAYLARESELLALAVPSRAPIWRAAAPWHDWSSWWSHPRETASSSTPRRASSSTTRPTAPRSPA